MERKDDRNKIRLEKTLRLGEILLKQGLISGEQLYQALEIQKTKKKILGEILVENGFISEEILALALAKEYALEFVDLTKEKIDERIVKLFSHPILKKYRIFPLRVEEGRLIVATSDPLDILSIQEMGRLAGYPAKPVLATLKQIELCINKYSAYLQEATEVIKEIMAKKKPEETQEVQERLLKELEVAVHEAPIVKLVNSIITEAIEQSSSDVHLEPQPNGLLVRFRIDGLLYERMTIPQDLRAIVTSRVKIISGMDIAERRMPQDGRLSIKVGERSFDVRVATLPGIYGEKVVLRLLDKESIFVPLKDLGLDADGLDLIIRLINHPYGIILSTGPTGAGKTTTLYSIINTLNIPTRNIVTVEEPVEYELLGIHQTAINIRAGYTFATALRHILRQDPDIIMVGEVRDVETAEIAIQAAITGHLVLSTLHTNNAPGAITRLLDMNIEPFLISSAVIGVIAQRLVRKLCSFCKKEYTASEDLKKSIADLLPKEIENLVLAKPQGCEKCRNIGYLGRTGIFEVLCMTDELRELTLKKADEAELSRVAISQGMRTLRVNGIKKALDKTTSLEEVMRVTFIEEA